MFVSRIDTPDSIAPAAAAAAAGRDDGLLVMVAGLALAIGLLHRLLVGWSAPIWLDETFSATIAAQPTFGGLLHWCLTELTGPAYYMPLWAWEKIAGAGDTALRLPSLACSIAAPAIVLRWGHRDRRTRLLWAGLLAVWLPGLDYANEAKPYAEIVLLTTAQAILFLRMMRTPAARSALPWVLLSSLAILTHYHTLLISGLQGLAYLAFGGRRAWRSWPAAVAFLPAAAWMAFQLPFVLAFADPKVVWYSVLPPRAVFALPAMLIGMERGPAAPPLALAFTIAASGAWFGWRRWRGAPGGMRRPEALLVTSGLVAVGIVFAMGFVRPSFAPRYLIPYMPAVLFGVACWLRALDGAMPRAGAVGLALAAALGLAHLTVRVGHPELDHRNYFNFERPCAWLRMQGVERLVFLWDNPSANVPNPRIGHNLRDVGGFFFRRDHGPAVPIDAPLLGGDADPNPPLARALRTPGTAILWSYDFDVPGTRAIRYPSRLAATIPGIRCRNFGGGDITVLACIRPPMPAR